MLAAWSQEGRDEHFNKAPSFGFHVSLTSWASHRMQLGVSKQTRDATHLPNLSREPANQH